MKKIVVTLLSVVLIAGVLTACSKADTNNPASDKNPSSNETGNGDQTNNSKVTVDEILTSIKAAYGEDYRPNMEIDAEMLKTEFGLTSDMYKEVKAEQPMIGTHADRVVIVKAAEGKAEKVEAALNTAKENKINDTLQYPMNIAKINATKVVRNGDFVAFLLVGAINESMDANEEEAKKFAEKEVEKGVKAFNDLFK